MLGSPRWWISSAAFVLMAGAVVISMPITEVSPSSASPVAPSFTLDDPYRGPVVLRDLVEEHRAVVVVFYRGYF